jgi:hypothetical protein
LAQLAGSTGLPSSQKSPGKNFGEEKTTDTFLTEIARSVINYNAALQEETNDGLTL